MSKIQSFNNLSRSYREVMKGFFILTKVNQCESVSGIESHFSIVLDTRNVPISAQSKPGSRVGGRRQGENISDFYDLILEYQCSPVVTVTLPLYLSTHLELRIEPPLKH